MELRPLRHRGKVLSVAQSRAIVEFTDACGGACGGCKFAGLCGGGNDAVVVTASYSKSETIRCGQSVVVEAAESSTLHAAVVLLCLPLVVFLLSAVLLSSLGVADYLAGVGALVAALACYCMARFVDGKRKPIWYIVKSDS